MPVVASTDAPPAMGDPETWVDLHGDALLRIALLRVGDQATAEDLVQETLLAAWRTRGTFRGDCAPRTWLVSILKRRVADHYRLRNRPGGGPSQDLDSQSEPCGRVPAVGSGAEANEFWSVVTGCTGELPDHLARAFRLRTFGEQDPTAICEAEGITRKNLSVRLHRARQLLRRCLESRWT